MKLSSSAFASQDSIPKRYTCDGDDVSPPLEWSQAPAAAKSLALVMYDPDAPDPSAPKITWVHWVLYDLPTADASFPEAVKSIELPAGAREGRNSWERTGYGGPCPPVGRHRYFFKLFALDRSLGDLGRPSMDELLVAMKGHVVGEVELIGTYLRGHDYSRTGEY